MNVFRHLSQLLVNRPLRVIPTKTIYDANSFRLALNFPPSSIRVSSFCSSTESNICTDISRLRIGSRDRQLLRLSLLSRHRAANTSLPFGYVSNIQHIGIRSYSTDDRGKSSDPNANTELKGVVVHFPSPLMWLKNKWYTYCIKSAIDKSFNLEEFLYGAKQALSVLTRLIIQKDYEMLKSVATQEAVDTVMQLIMPWTDEQQQSIEVLVDDITLATASVTSISKHESSYEVNIDVLCIAVKRYKSRPLLIQMTVRFKRQYGSITASDWIIADIREFTVRELTAAKASNQQPK